ncbi:MAG: tautomerase family protein [Solirubrobacteraceae bacterium]|jgi:4-oxalocrotonate tautomerase
MPLVRISVKRSESEGFIERVGDAVHRAMAEAIGVPEGDQFQVITEHDEGLVYDPTFLGINRTPGIIVIQITLAAGRSTELKKKLYKTIADQLAKSAGVRPEDVFVNLIEVLPENFSFGNGEAQFADALPPHLRETG